MAVASLIVVFLLFGFYGWTSGVGCGLAVTRLLPSSTLTRHALKLLSPFWEITNAFLLCGMLGFAGLFHAKVVGIGLSLLPSLVAGFVAVFIRAVLLAVMDFRDSRVGLTLLNWIFLVVSFAVPFCFGAAGIHLLTGHGFWANLPGWLLTIMLLSGLVSVALNFVYYIVGETPRGRLQLMTRVFNIWVCVLGALVLRRVALHSLPLLLTPSYVGFVGLISLIIVFQMLAWIRRQERYMLGYISLVAILAPLLLALADRPYLVAYPQYTLSAAYGVLTHGNWWVAALSAALVFLVAGTAILAWRLLAPPAVVPVARKRLPSRRK